jgi:hypothetical protein
MQAAATLTLLATIITQREEEILPNCQTFSMTLNAFDVSHHYEVY